MFRQRQARNPEQHADSQRDLARGLSLPSSPARFTSLSVCLIVLASATQAQDYSSRIRVHSDILAPVQGNRVEIRQDNTAFTLITDANGFTTYANPTPNSPMEVLLHPGRTREGRLVGQRLFEHSNAPTGSHPRFDTFWYTQPLAIATHFDSTTATLPRGLHDRWAFERSGSQTSYNFNASVACLALEHEVDGYFDYHRISPADDHSAGLLIKYNGDPLLADLEDSLLYFDIEALSISNSTDVTTYFKPKTVDDFGGSTLTARFVGLHGPYALVSIDGQLGRGDNLIMFSGSNNDSIGPLEIYSAPNFFPVSPPSAGGSSSTGGSCSNCDTTAAYDRPPTFNPNFPTDPPASDSVCLDSVWIAGGTETVTLTTIGDRSCNDGVGGPTGSSHCVESGTKVRHSYKNKQTTRIHAGGSAGGGSFTNETTREYSFEYTTKTTHCTGHEPNPSDDCGNDTALNCGECVQYYQYGYEATKRYRRFWNFLHLNCFPEDLTMRSIGTGEVNLASCSRETGKATNGTQIGNPEHCD